MRKIAAFFIFIIISICLISLPVFHAVADPVPLPAPTGLYWDGTVAHWNPVENAESYIYSIQCESTITGHKYLTSNSCSEAYLNVNSFINGAIQSFGQANDTIKVKIRVKAVSESSSDYSSSEYSDYSSILEYKVTGYTKLIDPVNLRWDGTAARWDPVPNAENYYLTFTVKQNGNELTTLHGGMIYNCSYDPEASIYSYAKRYSYISGMVEITFTVKAQNRSSTTYLSSEEATSTSVMLYNMDTYEFVGVDPVNRLPAPDGLYWDGTIARWNTVDNAQSYFILYSLDIPGEPESFKYTYSSVPDPFYDMSSIIDRAIIYDGFADGTINGRFQVKCIPIESSGYTSSCFSNESEELNYDIPKRDMLDIPTGLYWDGFSAKWNIVQGAAEYYFRFEISDNNGKMAMGQNIKTNSFDISDYTVILDDTNRWQEENVSITFTVRAVSLDINYCSSDTSPESDFLVYNRTTKKISYMQNETPIDAEHFPEESFRRYVSEEHIDQNQNGYLSLKERSALTTLLHDEESEYRLHSLQGIEYFPNLTTIVCSWDPITEVDLSHNKSLSHLEFIDCPIGTLDISDCPILLTAVQANPTRTRYEPGSWDQWDEIAGCIFIDTRTKIVAGDLVIPGSTASMATITKAPVARVLTYTGAPQELVIPGTAKDGVLGYSTEDAYLYYTGTIPTATEVGEYTIWYRAFGDDDHHHSEPRCMTARIVPAIASVFEPSIPQTLTAPPWSYLITDSKMLYPYSFFEMGDNWNLDVNNSPYAGSFVSVYNQEGKLQYSVYDQDHIGSFAKDARVQAFYNATGSLSEIQIEAEIITDATTNDTNFFRYVFDKDGVLTEILNEGGVIYSYDFATKAWKFVEDYVEGRTTEEFEAENGGPIDYLIQAQVNVTLNYQALGHITLMDLTPDLILPANTTTIEDEAFAGVQNKLIRISNNTTAISDIAFDPSVVILCKAGSYARTWAEKNEIAYIIER